MKKKLLVFLAFIPFSLCAQWVQTNGPRGGYIYSLSTKDTLVIAGTNEGIFITGDNGANWTASAAGNISYIYSLAVNDSNIFAGLQSGSIYKSPDNGNNWLPVNNGLPGVQVNSLITMGDLVFAGLYNKGVFLTTNQGSSWDSVNSGINSLYIKSLATMGSIIFAGTSGNGVSMSTDSGGSWTSISNGLDTFITVLEVKDTNLFAGTNGGIFRYSLTANQWTQINNGIDILNISDIHSIGNELYAASRFPEGRIYYSVNNGNSWTRIDNGMNGMSILSLLKSNNHLYAGTNFGGVFTSSDNGLNWAPSLEGLPHIIVFALQIDGSNIFSGTWRCGVSKSMDLGNSWSLMNNGLPANESVYSIAMSGDTIYAGTEHYGVYRSYDHGVTWLPPDSMPFVGSVNSIEIINGNIFAGAESRGAFISTNHGISWQQINQGLLIQFPTVNDFSHLGSKIFAATNDRVWVSNNNGSSWDFAGVGLPVGDVTRIISDGSFLYAASFLYGIYLSVDSGNTWNSINGISNPIYIHELKKINSTLYAGLAGGVIYTNDTGATWSAMTGFDNNSFNPDWVTSLVTDGIYLFAGSNRGVFSTSNLWAINEFIFPESDLKLFPNPMNSIDSRIIINTGKKNLISKIFIYNIYGKVVFIDNDFRKTELNIKLASGVYIVKYYNGMRVVTEKLVVE
jgi:hypothetical protein